MNWITTKKSHCDNDIDRCSGWVRRARDLAEGLVPMVVLLGAKEH